MEHDNRPDQDWVGAPDTDGTLCAFEQTDETGLFVGGMVRAWVARWQTQAASDEAARIVKVGAHLTITRQTLAFNQNSNYWLDVEAFQAGIGGASGEWT